MPDAGLTDGQRATKGPHWFLWAIDGVTRGTTKQNARGGDLGRCGAGRLMPGHCALKKSLERRQSQWDRSWAGFQEKEKLAFPGREKASSDHIPGIA